MSELRATLVTDGSSDRVLRRVIEWLCKEVAHASVSVTWADLRVLPTPPTLLAERARAASDLHPCDVIFVHRDAERAEPSEREGEIRGALASETLPFVCVVPVRMTEAWFLFDERAIRHAAGNPKGTDPLDLPDMSRVERLPDPKATLKEALRTASGLSSRRLERFDAGKAFHRLADAIESFEPLRALEAFQRFEAALRKALNVTSG